MLRASFLPFDPRFQGHLCVHTLIGWRVQKGQDDLANIPRRGRGFELIGNGKHADEPPLKTKAVVLDAIDLKVDGCPAKSGRPDIAVKPMTRRDRFSEVQRHVDKRSTDISVQFELKPAIAVQMGLPPGIYGIKSKPGKPCGVSNSRRIAIAPRDAYVVTKGVFGMVRISRFQRDTGLLRASHRARLPTAARYFLQC